MRRLFLAALLVAACAPAVEVTPCPAPVLPDGTVVMWDPRSNTREHVPVAEVQDSAKAGWLIPCPRG